MDGRFGICDVIMHSLLSSSARLGTQVTTRLGSYYSYRVRSRILHRLSCDGAGHHLPRNSSTAQCSSDGALSYVDVVHLDERVSQVFGVDVWLSLYHTLEVLQRSKYPGVSSIGQNTESDIQRHATRSTSSVAQLAEAS